MLSVLFSQDDDDAANARVKEYVEFVSQHPEIKAIGGKTGVKNMGRFIHVASYIPLSPPPATPIAATPTVIKEEMMSLLFARNVKYIHSCILSNSRDLEEVIAAVGKPLNSSISEFKSPDESAESSFVRTESPVTHLVYRLFGLSKFSSIAVAIPENNSSVRRQQLRILWKAACTYKPSSKSRRRSIATSTRCVTPNSDSVPLLKTIEPITKFSPFVCC